MRGRAALAAASFVSLWMASSLALAFPGGGGGATVGAAGSSGSVGSVGVGSGGGGGRGASVGNVGPAASAGISTGQHIGSRLGGGNVGGARSLSPGFSNAAPAGGVAGGGRLVSPGFNNLSHPAYSSGRVANTGITTYPGGVPAYNQRFDGVASVPRLGDARSARTQPIYRSSVPVRNNAWTDARTARVSPAARLGAADRSNRAYDPGQAYLRNGGLTPGQHLYPGAADYSALNAANNRPWQEGYRGRDGYRGGRYRHYPVAFGGLFYPYFYGGFFPGYYGAFADGYGDSFGLSSPYNNGPVNGEITNDTDGTNGGYDQGAGGVARDPFNDPQLPANQPQVGPSGPAAEANPSAQNGPDSLVEAVQGELATRGYLSGQADGMYGDSTRAALRRFQTDQKLPATGRVNEATLHALQLD